MVHWYCRGSILFMFNRCFQLLLLRCTVQHVEEVDLVKLTPLDQSTLVSTHQVDCLLHLPSSYLSSNLPPFPRSASRSSSLKNINILTTDPPCRLLQFNQSRQRLQLTPYCTTRRHNNRFRRRVLISPHPVPKSRAMTTAVLPALTSSDPVSHGRTAPGPNRPKQGDGNDELTFETFYEKYCKDLKQADIERNAYRKDHPEWKGVHSDDYEAAEKGILLMDASDLNVFVRCRRLRTFATWALKKVENPDDKEYIKQGKSLSQPLRPPCRPLTRIP